MKRLSKGIILALFSLVVLSGCERDPATLLSDGIWKFSNLTTTSTDEDHVSLVALFKAFMTDATLEFNADGTYILSSPLADDPSTGTWELIGDDQLILNPDDEAVSTANIETLSKDELVFIETYYDMDQDPYSVTTSWKR